MGELEIAAGREGVELDLAGLVQVVHAHESFADRAARGEQAVVAHDHHVLVAEVSDELAAFLDLHQESVVVVGDPVVEDQGHLVDRQQAAAERRYRGARLGVGVDRARRVGSGDVYRTVDGKPGGDRWVLGVAQDVAFEVHLHEAGGGDLLEEQSVGVDEDVVFGIRNPHRGVGGGEIRHPELGEEAKAGGEFDPGLPLRGGEVRMRVERVQV